jgi:3-oxoacyl-[acyl-carrier protein] reductase
LPTRRVGQPEDAAATYLFAMQNPYLTGQVLSVDGGSSII